MPRRTKVSRTAYVIEKVGVHHLGQVGHIGRVRISHRIVIPFKVRTDNQRTAVLGLIRVFRVERVESAADGRTRWFRGKKRFVLRNGLGSSDFDTLNLVVVQGGRT